ncbi:MAG: hypothetical protein KJO98_04125 [Rhodothermia bacterium]|nr:hypothetical protein [Rhodothermia bacterium]
MALLRENIRFAHADSAQGGASVADASVEAGVESEDMDAAGIVRVVFGVAALVVVIVIAVFQIVNLEVQDVRLATASEAADTGALKDLQLAAIQKLNRYEPVAGAEGTFRIPIDRALELMANESYDRPASDYSNEMILLRE